MVFRDPESKSADGGYARNLLHSEDARDEVEGEDEPWRPWRVEAKVRPRVAHTWSETGIWMEVAVWI
jgi:hypothetical protein